MLRGPFEITGPATLPFCHPEGPLHGTKAPCPALGIQCSSLPEGFASWWRGQTSDTGLRGMRKWFRDPVSKVQPGDWLSREVRKSHW